MQVNVKLLESFPFDVVDMEKFLKPAKEGDAGFDLVSAEDVDLLPGERKLIGTGIAVALPRPAQTWNFREFTVEGFVQTDVPVLHLSPRSGVAAKRGLTLVNSPGVVDSGFRNEVKLIAQNTNPVVSVAALQALIGQDRSLTPVEASSLWRQEVKENTIHIRRGDRLAQAVFSWVVQPRFSFVEELDETERGMAGFGSSGR